MVDPGGNGLARFVGRLFSVTLSCLYSVIKTHPLLPFRFDFDCPTNPFETSLQKGGERQGNIHWRRSMRRRGHPGEAGDETLEYANHFVTAHLSP